jgi:flagellar biosynthesis protein FliP
MKSYKSEIMEQFGTTKDNSIHSIAFIGLIIIAITNIVLAIIYKKYIILWGILAVIIGMLSTSPSNPYWRKLCGLCGLALVLSFFYMTWEWRVIIGSMAISQILSMTAREQLRKVLIDRSLASEAIFCYLYRYKMIYIFKKK